MGTSNDKEEEINASGWDAITECFEKIYPGQDSPKHYGVVIPWILGGKSPLDGISVYDGGDYWHFVTYGLSELYDKESEDMEYSGYGMEFTYKLKKGCYDQDSEEDEIKSVCGLLQQIARTTFENDELYQSYEYLYTGQTQGVDFKQTSAITGFITIPDPQAGSIDTPNGKVEFIEFIGVTNADLQQILNKEISVRELYEKLGTDVTDYRRRSE